ncbi:PHD finger protein 20-like protein 1 [Copidosoma floridanum]|uniref:PHD finger protein 20-like protein 1 n=1 Tax=Copidosoma floridanum TaxID=29053 RepID=UPI0006C9E10D|nr:PHD finger protein 20-like protein 1 [Copidosoma floridanum]
MDSLSSSFLSTASKDPSNVTGSSISNEVACGVIHSSHISQPEQLQQEQQVATVDNTVSQVAALNAVEKGKRNKSGGGPPVIVDNHNNTTAIATTTSTTAIITTTKTKTKTTTLSSSSKSSSSKMSNRAGLNFIVGSKLEAKDFNEKWYSAKVVETDWSEREVLIHFEKWNSRYDEWIPMDSSRLRVLQTNPRDAKSKEFTVGERILATWADGKKYPAKVNAALGNDKYDVLFDDGYSKHLKSSKMTKIVEFAVAAEKFDEQEQTELQQQQQQQNTYVGSKQERRDKKRKHTVTELFQHKKKTKSESDKTVKRQDLNSAKSGAKVDHHTVGALVVEPNLATEVHQNVVAPGNAEDDYATYIGDLRVEIEDSMYKCPIAGCNKNFRKENLLQMHIKHYHPEYSKYLGSTPNVADLAYARTIGESVEDVLPKKSRAPPIQVNQTVYASPSIPHVPETELSQVDADNKLDSKHYLENNTSLTEDNSSEQSNSCTMSPGTLFDMRYKEERTHTGIKTLPPVRHITSAILDDSEHSQYSGVPIDQKSSEKPKPQRKRQHSESASKNKRQQKSISEHEESNDHFEDTILDGDDTIDSSYKCSNISNNKSELDNADSMQSQAENVIIIDGEVVKVEKLRREEIINCICGITEEDGLMIQCDLCLCWQHGICNSIEKEKDVPEKYVCYICQNSLRQRPSKKYIHDQDWIREGKLPTMQTSTDVLKGNEKAAMLKRSYDLITGLMQMQDILHSLRVKINISQSKDHPKLYLWAKNWSKVEIPTFPLDPVPIMEVIKAENPSDTLDKTIHDKLDFSFSIKTEPDQKSITSDTELMSILEDGSHNEKSKFNVKSTSPVNKDDGQISTCAPNTNEIKEEKGQQTLQIKQEICYDSPTNHNLSFNNTDKTMSFTATSEVGGTTVNALQRPVIPEPEAPIDPVDCKLRLLEHIEHYQNYVEKALTFVENQLSALEDMNNDDKRDTSKDVRTKQTTQMILRDLESMRKMAALSKMNQV